jgi:hypothetical protein
MDNLVRVNPDRNMRSGKLCSQLSTYRHVGFRSKRTFRAAGETEISTIGLNWMKETLDFSF